MNLSEDSLKNDIKMTLSRLPQLLQFLKEDPKDAFILFAIAKEYEKLGNLETALSYYLKLLEIQPDYIGTYYHLGKLYQKKAALEKAMTTFETGIEIAKKIKDQHALSELMNAKINLEI